MSLIAALSLAAASPEYVVVGPLGPELHRAPVEERVEPQPAVAEPPEPKCLKASRIFNYSAHALDVATTARALDRGAVEAGPLARPILGARPNVLELLVFKAIPLLGLRLLDEHIVKRGNPKQACYLNAAFGLPALVAAGLNTRYAF